MTATFELVRSIDHSGVSGTGIVAEGIEWGDGSVALRWYGEHPSTAVWGSVGDMEIIHGHGGDTVVRYFNHERLVRAYQRVVPFLVQQATSLPLTVGSHPDHPDRLRLTFATNRAWRWWVALLEGSTHAATHTAVAGEIHHTWIDPSGDIFLQYFTPVNQEDNQ